MFNKCEFCQRYYPNSKGEMKCHATNYELQYDYACKDALDRMMLVLTAERCKEENYYVNTRKS